MVESTKQKKPLSLAQFKPVTKVNPLGADVSHIATATASATVNYGVLGLVVVVASWVGSKIYRKFKKKK